MRELPPETEWFRPPNHFECARYGDIRSFMWVCEITRRDIYGVSYRVSANLEFEFKEREVLELLKEAAKTELYRRIEIEERIPEGSLMERCLWVPVITRREDGTVLVGSFDAIDLEVSPQGVFVTKGTNLDAKNLYARPGKFIPVDGPVSEIGSIDPWGGVRDRSGRLMNGDDQLEPGSGT